ncbi:PREDICTED: fibropellin-1-like [Branchiostoma belcheri]|uniref:lysozyme n=1 Tax=Branchiostoma belcheri TaxID=7741 RepID=A0A6P4YBC1_BRABE|nr:PREDICTED: fibropellin-1-like [Branchiostoma belcheri]
MRVIVGLLLCLPPVLYVALVGGGRVRKRCKPLVFPDTIRDCDKEPNAEGRYPSGTVCNFECRLGCVKDTGGTERVCKVKGRSKWWTGGRGLKCRCRPCDGAPSHPEGYTSDCGAATYQAGHTCVFTCPAGNVKVSGDERKVCVNSHWRGEDLVCEEINECSSDPCANGGICNDGVDSYTCTCAPGYEGDHCETDTDECSSDPCENGGICNDGVDSYTCTCAPGYEGDHCETDTDECSSDPCANGGTCNDGVDSYTCTCAPGYEGDHCETVTFDECVDCICEVESNCEMPDPLCRMDGGSLSCGPFQIKLAYWTDATLKGGELMGVVTLLLGTWPGMPLKPGLGMSPPARIGPAYTMVVQTGT